MRYYAAVTVLAVACVFSVKAEEPGNGEALKNNDRIAVQSARAWVAGTRYWLGVTVKNVKPTDIRGPIKESRAFDFYGYSYSLRNARSGKLVADAAYREPRRVGVRVDAKGRQREGVRVPAHMLKSGESLRLLFALPWPVKAAPPEGDYKLRVCIHAAAGAEMGQVEFEIKLRNPSVEEKPTLKLIDLDGRKWARAKEGVPAIDLPDSLKNNTGLAFELLLSRLSNRQGVVADLGEDELPTDLPAMFSPEIDVLRYEILRSKKLTEKAKELRGKILKEHPGIQFRLDDVDKGRGALVSIIKPPPVKKKTGK
jgi:hypothetical protein